MRPSEETRRVFFRPWSLRVALSTVPPPCYTFCYNDLHDYFGSKNVFHPLEKLAENMLLLSHFGCLVNPIVALIRRLLKRQRGIELK